MLLYEKIYWPEAITTMIWPYELKAFIEKLNALKVGGYGITPMDNLSVTTTDFYYLKTPHMGLSTLCLV